MNLQDEYVELKTQIAESAKRIEEIEKTLFKNFHKSLPTFILPQDARLNWWASLTTVVWFQPDGTITVPKMVRTPSVTWGGDSKDHKAGTKFKVVTSWKTNKKAQGTHYILTQIRGQSPRITHFYG